MMDKRAETRAANSHNLQMAAELLLVQLAGELAECVYTEPVARPALQTRLERRMIRERKRPGRKRLALTAVAAALLLGLMGCAAILTKLFPLLAREQATHIDYGVVDASALTVFTCLPERIPPGYMQQEPVITPLVRDLHFVDGEGHTIRFTESASDLTVSVDNEANEQRTVTLENGETAYLIGKGSHATLFWAQEDVFLCLQGEINDETILWIANGVRRAK